MLHGPVENLVKKSWPKNVFFQPYIIFFMLQKINKMLGRMSKLLFSTQWKWVVIYTAKFHKELKAQRKKYLNIFTSCFMLFLFICLFIHLFCLLHYVFTSLMQNRCILSIISCCDLKKRGIINKMRLSKWRPFKCNFIMTSFWCQFNQYNISLYTTMSLTGTVWHNESEITVSQDI